jgi:hypothetical protein
VHKVAPKLQRSPLKGYTEHKWHEAITELRNRRIPALHKLVLSKPILVRCHLTLRKMHNVNWVT